MWAVFFAMEACQWSLGHLQYFNLTNLMGNSRLSKTHCSNNVRRLKSTAYKGTSAKVQANQIAMGNAFFNCSSRAVDHTSTPARRGYPSSSWDPGSPEPASTPVLPTRIHPLSRVGVAFACLDLRQAVVDEVHEGGRLRVAVEAAFEAGAGGPEGGGYVDMC